MITKTLRWGLIQETEQITANNNSNPILDLYQICTEKNLSVISITPGVLRLIKDNKNVQVLCKSAGIDSGNFLGIVETFIPFFIGEVRVRMNLHHSNSRANYSLRTVGQQVSDFEVYEVLFRL